jgi:hypothetical protein
MALRYEGPEFARWTYFPWWCHRASGRLPPRSVCSDLGLLDMGRYACPRRANSNPQPLFQTILFQLFAGTDCEAVEPGEPFADRDRVFFLRRLDLDRQPGRCPKRQFRKNTSAKCGHRLYGSFVDTLGRNLNGVLDIIASTCRVSGVWPFSRGFHLRSSSFAASLRINVAGAARDAVEDRVLGLDTGADDYLVKPFAFPELLARVPALSRRGNPDSSSKLRVGDLELDVNSRSAMRAGKVLDLTAREFELLEYLLRHQGHVVSREMLTRDVWKEAGCHTPLDNVIDVQ